MTEEHEPNSPSNGSSLEDAAAGGPLPGMSDDVSDGAPAREDVATDEEGVIPTADNDLDPDRTPADREQAIGADETVGGINMSGGLTN